MRPKLAAIALVAAVLIAWHLFSWYRGAACLVGRAPWMNAPCSEHS